MDLTESRSQPSVESKCFAQSSANAGDATSEHGSCRVRLRRSDALSVKNGCLSIYKCPFFLADPTNQKCVRSGVTTSQVHTTFVDSDSLHHTDFAHGEPRMSRQHNSGILSHEFADVLLNAHCELPHWTPPVLKICANGDFIMRSLPNSYSRSMLNFPHQPALYLDPAMPAQIGRAHV